MQQREVFELPHCPQQNTKAFDIMTTKIVGLFTHIFLFSVVFSNYRYYTQKKRLEQNNFPSNIAHLERRKGDLLHCSHYHFGSGVLLNCECGEKERGGQLATDVIGKAGLHRS